MIRTLVTAAVLTAASAAAAAPAQNQCFFVHQLGATKATDNRTLYARVGLRDIYRFDMVDACPGLQANTRGYKLKVRGSDTICSPTDVDITIRDTHWPCMVKTMTKLTPAEASALPHADLP